MRLPNTGREYVTWTATGAPDGITLDVTFDRGTTWHTLERTGNTVKALVAGPAATANPAGTIVLTLGRNTATIRATDNPEVVVRGGGVVDVFST